MKTQYRNMLWLAALPLAFAMGACQNEEIVEAGQSANIEGQTVLRAMMGSYNAPQSRAQVELGNEDESQEVFMWNAEDAFTVYDTGNAYTQHIFTISGYNEESPSAEAMFIGEGEISEGTEVTAIYPAQESSAVSGDVVTLTLPQTALTDGADEAWKSYMSQNMFMYAQATMAGANTALTFNQLCAMVRISYTNATDTDQNISKVTLTGDGNYFGNSMNFNLKTYEENVTPTTSVSLEFTNLTVAPGRTVDFYLLFFPGDDASNGKLTISIDESQVEMSLADMTTQAFEAGKRYWLNVMQTKADGLIWKKKVAEGVITNLSLINIIENANGVQFSKDDNGFVNVAENQEIISKIKELDLSYRDDISDVDGIQYFTNLESLDIMKLGAESLDVSQMKNLKYLRCGENPLGKLDVSNNTQLEFLECFRTDISELNVSNNPNLVTLLAGFNKFTELDLSQNAKLETLDLTGGYSDSEVPSSYLTMLDLTHNPELISVRVNNSQFLTSIDVSQNENLEVLQCSYTPLTSLDVSANKALKTLGCDNCNQLTAVDVSNNSNLEFLDIGNTKIAMVNLDKKEALVTLYCSNTLLSDLDVSQNTELRELQCSGIKIVSLDLSKNEKLEKLECSGLTLPTLDLKYNQQLTSLRCTSSQFKTLDLTNNLLLEELYCSDSQIESLDLSKNTALRILECGKCHLTDLDISNNVNLLFRYEWGGVVFYCGNQYDESGNIKPLTLHITSDQQSQWEDIKWEVGNENVTEVIK